jgi:hypothetical protein
MNLIQHEINTVTYIKEDGDTSTRVIIPTFIPAENIRALDVTQLSSEEQTKMADAYKEYQVYVKFHMSSMFSFGDWLSHTESQTAVPAWKSFKLSGLSSA